MGWHPLPIRSHDPQGNGAGKAPGIHGWQKHAQFEVAGATAADLKAWQRREQASPGTGIACGSVVAIDIDFGSDTKLVARAKALATQVFGPTPFERQGAYPKLALVYRAAEPIRSVSLKAADGSGDGIDILAEGRQFVAYGIHPKTLQPYTWIGAEQPLVARPDQAPEISQDQIDDFLARLREIIELNGTGGRTGRGGGSGSGEIVRGADGRVIDGREWHLFRTVYTTARAMKAEGTEITVPSLTERAWQAFVDTTVLDDGRWSLEAARVKATSLLDRVNRRVTNLGPAPARGGKSVQPTYPDQRRSVAEGRAETRAVISAFFAEHVPAWRRSRMAWNEANEAEKNNGQESLEEPSSVSWGARVETAIGKTTDAIEHAARAAKAGLSIVYAAPYHSLLSELAQKFKNQDVEARVYRGYTSLDPEASGAAMCLDPDATKDAREAGCAIQSAVCERRVDKQKLLCKSHGRCGMQRQRRAKPTVWLVPHARLFQAKPEFIPTPDALVIDEGITMAALPDEPAQMSLDAIVKADFEPGPDFVASSNDANDLQSARGALLRALSDHREDGPLQREILLRNDVTVGLASTAYRLEWRRLRDPGITPGMPPEARQTCAAATGRHNMDVKLLAGIWAELRTFLSDDAEASGRLCLCYDLKNGLRILEHRSLNTIAISWRAPALFIDATLPDAALIEPVIGHRVEIRVNITAKWSPHVRVRQILGAPVSAQKLGIVEGKESRVPRRVVVDLLRLIRLRAALVGARTVVVIGQERLVEKLHAAGLPANVETGHFGAIAGIDRWARAAGLICIGRQQPWLPDVEALASILTGRIPEILPIRDSGGRHHHTEGGVRLATGKGVQVERVCHPDPVVEGLRWQITEAGLIQAIGRLRPLDRTAETPAFVDIISDVPLPISVDATPVWEDAKLGAWAEMASEGVLLESAADIMACFPEAATKRQAAREMVLPTLVATSIRDLNIGVTTNVRCASYKRLGRYPPASAVLLSNAPSDLKAWLFDRLGAIEWVKIEEPEPQREATPTATTGAGQSARLAALASVYAEHNFQAHTAGFAVA